MKKTIKNNSLIRFLKLIYLKIFRINDTPQKIACGFGLGVFLGILPGTGPIAALVLAYVFRVNRAASLLGALLTNTWISIVFFLLSIKVGSVIMGVSWQDVYQKIILITSNFRWSSLFTVAALKILLPLLIGYLVLGIGLGVAVYLIVLLILRKK